MKAGSFSLQKETIKVTVIHFEVQPPPSQDVTANT
jgi:hypothetical protein